MVKEPYKVLGLSEDSSFEELKARYEELKKQYGEQRFLAGEEGNEGARKLMELEEAWTAIQADIERRNAKERFGGDYGHIDELVKQGKYDEAQSLLDSVSDRTAEWHYFQALVFYKRDWLTESKQQLEMAVEMDPRNTKYKTALDKMNMVIGNPNTNAQNLGNNQQTQQQQQPYGQDPNAAMGMNCLSNCCLAYCLTDCCCNLMQCCG